MVIDNLFRYFIEEKKKSVKKIIVGLRNRIFFYQFFQMLRLRYLTENCLMVNMARNVSSQRNDCVASFFFIECKWYWIKCLNFLHLVKVLLILVIVLILSKFHSIRLYIHLPFDDIAFSWNVYFSHSVCANETLTSQSDFFFISFHSFLFHGYWFSNIVLVCLQRALSVTIKIPPKFLSQSICCTEINTNRNNISSKIRCWLYCETKVTQKYHRIVLVDFVSFFFSPVCLARVDCSSAIR